MKYDELQMLMGLHLYVKSMCGAHCPCLPENPSTHINLYVSLRHHCYC